jgi:predicted HAD superfamily hydrolase
MLRHYGITQKMVSIYKIFYVDVQCKVFWKNNLIDSIKSGVTLGRILSPFIFILVIGWLMEEITKQGIKGITWTHMSVLEEAKLTRPWSVRIAL